MSLDERAKMEQQSDKPTASNMNKTFSLREIKQNVLELR